MTKALGFGAGLVLLVVLYTNASYQPEKFVREFVERPRVIVTTPTPIVPAKTSFFVVGDLHFGKVISGEEDLLDGEVHDEGSETPRITEWNKVQLKVFRRLIVESPNAKFSGIIIAGDVTDDGQREQWEEFESYYGGPGVSSSLATLPVFETSGNHEYSRKTKPKKVSESEVYSLKRIAERNEWRKTVHKQSIVDSTPAGLYAVRFPRDVLLVNLGVKVSDYEDQVLKRKVKSSPVPVYRNIQPFASLAFLKKVLNGPSVTATTRIVLNFHFPVTSKWNSSEEREALFAVLKDAAERKRGRVVALVSAHRHHTKLGSWCGLPIFESGTPMQFSHGAEMDAAFTILEIGLDDVQARSISYDINGNVNQDIGKCNLADPDLNKCYRYSKRIDEIRLEPDCRRF